MLAKLFLRLVLFCLFCSLFTSSILKAQDSYEMTDDGVYFSSPSHAVVEKKEFFDIHPYEWSLRFGGGYALSLLDFDFKREGILEGVEAFVLDKDEKTGFNFCMNIEGKVGMPKPFDKFAVGVSINYHFTSAEELEIDIQGATNVVASEDDVTKFHVLSFMAFLEYRYPFQVGKTWISPYARAGIGLNINMNSNRDLFDVEDATLAMMFAVGFEYHVSSKMSLFFEPRWHYNRADFVFRPFDGQSRFKGTVDLSSIAFLIGVNFYFGIGENL